MLKIKVEEIISKISEKTGLPPEAINKKIDEKVEELSGLVSREGAAHIIANEFGIQLFKPTTNRLQIKNIIPGLKSISIIARVLRIYPVKDYTKNGKTGKIASFLVGDETGKLRIVFWDNSQIKMIEDGKLNEGDLIRITNCYVKEGFKGVELHATKRSKIEINPNLPEAKEIPKAEELFQRPTRVSILNLEPGNFEIRGAIVQIFENSNPFFNVCPECGKRLNDSICEEHGEVKPRKRMLLSLILDDGTSNIRVVLFGAQAERLLGISSAEAYEKGIESGNLGIAIKEKKDDLLGSEILVEGNVSKNEFSGELEMIAKRVSFINPILEARELIKELEVKS